MLKLNNDVQATDYPVRSNFDSTVSDLVTEYFPSYKLSGNYLYIGEPLATQGWIIHLSVLPRQLNAFLTDVLPIIHTYQVPCKIINSREELRSLNNGFFGKNLVGKAITIYWDQDAPLDRLISDLFLVCNGLSAPPVKTDFLIRDNIYMRYGNFKNQPLIDSYGNRHRYIKDPSGSILLDFYYDPPKIPDWVPNPLPNLSAEHYKPLFNPKITKYKQLSVIKADIKGNVFKCAYMKFGVIPAFCIIKQGNANMYEDDFGRDMTDSIRNQYELAIALQDIVPIPKHFELFEDGSGNFMVMQFVKGDKAVIRARKTLNNAHWSSVDSRNKIKIIQIVQNILSSIHQLHNAGYVHRDINGNNFLVSSRDRICMIDLESFYNTNKSDSVRAFGYGTPGFISPTQQKWETPKIQDDIYSIGAMLLQMLSGGLEPLMLIGDDNKISSDKVNLLIRDSELVNLILSCFSSNPAEQPDVTKIKSILSHYSSNLSPTSRYTQWRMEHKKSEILGLINGSIHSFSDETMSESNLWYMGIVNEYDNETYPLGDRHVSFSLHSGVSGVIFALWQAKRLGFDIDCTSKNMQIAHQFLQINAWAKLNQLAPGFFFGSTGLGMLLSKGISYGEIDNLETNGELIRQSYSTMADGFGFIHGVAGQGIGMLKCLEADIGIKIDTELQRITDYLLKSQQPDGSWKFVHEDGSSEKTTGFGYGIAGVVYFLLQYAHLTKNQDIFTSGFRGLHYLKKKVKRVNGAVSWNISDQRRYPGNYWCSGNAGIALTFLTAYRMTHSDEYLKIFDSALEYYPPEVVEINLSYCHGVTGLGDVYLEAFRSTQNSKWLSRSEWITFFLSKLAFKKGELGHFWRVEKKFPTSELMVGNAGVLSYMLRSTDLHNFDHFYLIN